MNADVLLSKFKGSIIGTAVGDALGASFEGSPHLTVDEVHAMSERHTVLRYTDDTHMMLGVAQSLVQCKGFSGEHMAQQFMDNFYKDPFRGYGAGPPRIFRLIKDGVPWYEASERIYRGGSFGNGGAMRIAPVGILYHDDTEVLRKIAYRSARITHAHILGKEGAALQAYAVALATKLSPSSEFDKAGFLKSLNAFAKQVVYIRKLQQLQELAPEDRPGVISKLGHGIEAYNSVPTAIFSFLSAPYSFEEAVTYAIGLGGDTDTIGAMTGAISGAYLGIEAIPGKWKEKLENMGYLESLGENLLQVSR